MIIASLACPASDKVTVFKAPYGIGKWLNVYHYFSSYRRQIGVFGSVWFIALCEILHSRQKKSTYFLKIPRTNCYYPLWAWLYLWTLMLLFAITGTEMTTAEDVINFLQNSSWIDSNTRAVLIEFNLFNPNMNLWGVSMYLIEFLQTGGKNINGCMI